MVVVVVVLGVVTAIGASSVELKIISFLINLKYFFFTVRIKSSRLSMISDGDTPEPEGAKFYVCCTCFDPVVCEMSSFLS